jgi:hypothetical protein
MNARVVCRLLIVLMWTAVVAVAHADGLDTARYVLFLGNSYTQFNDLPGLVQSLAQSVGHSLYKDRNTPGGHRLAEHAVNPISLARIAAWPWDYVVLQEFSLIAVIDSLRVNSMYPAARFLDEVIHDNGSQTMFFMTWGASSVVATIWMATGARSSRTSSRCRRSFRRAIGRSAASWMRRWRRSACRHQQAGGCSLSATRSGQLGLDEGPVRAVAGPLGTWRAQRADEEDVEPGLPDALSDRPGRRVAHVRSLERGLHGPHQPSARCEA